MKTIRLLTVMIVFLAFATGAAAFDGDRRGFILGVGVGYSPYVHHTQTHHGQTFEETKTGGAGYFGLGWGWDKRNVLMFEGNVAVFTSSPFGDIQAAQGFAGFTWNHYFGRQGNSLFTAVGLGSFAFRLDNGWEQPESVWDGNEIEYQAASPRQRGLGLLLGVGYEFAAHWQAGVYVAGGQTKAYEVDIDHLQVSVMVQVMAF